MSPSVRVSSPDPIARLSPVPAGLARVDASSPSSITEKMPPGVSEEMVMIMLNEQLDLRLEELESRLNLNMENMKDRLAELNRPESSTDSEDEKEKINLMIDLKLNEAIKELEERMRGEVEDVQRKVVKMQLAVKLTAMMQRSNATKPGELAAAKKARKDRETKVQEFKNLQKRVDTGELPPKDLFEFEVREIIQQT